ncbi:MAG: DUF5011 domain-containing protein [Romboutsia timonensis]|uniref:immunoglobulin-like domain-containing protein n=1 Tax=Romboutsia timonensis TaxID=1776391 RepID=UPI002A762DB0|nr:immunoglobulin-like domain-containing protein [Romboutsia timonensis]MDY3002572.1 DUF5011 domain-containing protein [Romboutsia timonensis]
MDFNVIVAIYNKNNLKNNKMILEVTHIKTQKNLKKNIYVVKDTDKLKGNVSISGSPIEGRTISADLSGLPTDIADVKYKWYVKDQSGQEELVQDQTGKDFVLKPEHVGKSIKVEVEAMNYLGTVYSNEVVVKSKNVAPVIQGIDPIEIKASEVDKFNNGENLKGVTAKDSNNNPINKIDVTGKVEKPSAGTDKVYKIKYSVQDKDGNETEVIRDVKVTNQIPTISGLTDIIITQGDNYNVKDGVTAEDYEDKTISNIVYPTDDLTKLDVGLHRIKYSVTDSDNNTVEEERTVIVKKKISSIGPKIQGIDDIELKVSQVDVFNASHQLTNVTVSDDIDSPSEITLSVSGKVEKPLGGNDGIYELTYTAVDSDLNETIEKRKVTVTNRKPTISGLTEITITKGGTFDITTGVTANDYEDGPIANIVYPTTDLSKLDIGTHKIKYLVTDSDGNTTEEERTAVVNKISSLNGPEIHGANDITLKVSQVDEFNKNHKLTGATAVDDIDTKVNISVSGEAKKPLAGTNETYELTYTAIDSDLNETVVKRKVTVTNQKPTISGLTEINITKGETADVRVGVTANDHEDGTITNIVYPTIDLSKLDIGTHKIKYSVTDSDGNTTEEERTVVVNKMSSLNGPEIHGANDITLKVSQVDEFNKNHKLTGVTVVDDIDTGLVATVSGDAGKPAPGKNEVYKLTYTVEDKDGNKTELVRNVTVTNQVPTISGLNTIVITEGENIELKSGITVHDFEDGDITKNLVCLTDLNTLTVGENTVYYSVKDTDGNIVNGERKVVILEKAEQQPDVPVVPETPQQPQQPEKPNTKPEDSIIENLPQIEGIEFEQGNATIESPLSVKVETVEGLKELLNLTEESNFTVDNAEEVKEDDNFLIYLIKITKNSVARASEYHIATARTEESYFIEVKVAKDNQEVIEHLESIVDKDNTNNENDTVVEDSTNNENDTIVEDKPNNNTPDKNENSSSNNTSNNNSNNLGDNSNETNTNKEENPKTYDGGVGSYILSGIGLLSIFNKRNRRKK